jgi:hypothetical protein
LSVDKYREQYVDHTGTFRSAACVAQRCIRGRGTGLSRMSKGEAYNFPLVREALAFKDAVFGVKSGFDRAGLYLGNYLTAFRTAEDVKPGTHINCMGTDTKGKVSVANEVDDLIDSLFGSLHTRPMVRIGYRMREEEHLGGVRFCQRKVWGQRT